jgi:hypothetical protein
MAIKLLFLTYHVNVVRRIRFGLLFEVVEKIGKNGVFWYFDDSLCNSKTKGEKPGRLPGFDLPSDHRFTGR